MSAEVQELVQRLSLKRTELNTVLEELSLVMIKKFVMEMICAMKNGKMLIEVLWCL